MHDIVYVDMPNKMGKPGTSTLVQTVKMMTTVITLIGKETSGLQYDSRIQ